MRPRIALIASSLLVGAAVAAAPAATAASTTPEIPAVPAAASAALPCQAQLSIIGAGNYREIRVADTTSAPSITEIGAVPGGRSIRALSTGFFHSDFGFTNRYHLGSNTATELFNLYVHTEQGGDSEIAVTLHNRGWGGFRRLVASGDAVESTRSNLYGLHDNGSIYRYRVTPGGGDKRILTGAGSVAGFSDLKTITLIGVQPTYDALLANTTSGQLVVIKIPTTTNMTATRTVIKTRTWQGFENLVVTDCHDGWNRVLVGFDHDTSSAYAYSMGFLQNSTSAIVGHGQLPGRWPWLVLNSIYESGLEPKGA